MKPVDFTSLHDYLDWIFTGCDPSEKEIIEAKKGYWRAYNTDLKRRRRKTHPCFQISFSMDELLLIREIKEEGKPLSEFIHQLAMENLGHYPIGTRPMVNTALIEQQLFLIAEYLRELLDHENVDTEKIEELETHIHTLETLIKELF